MTSPLKATLNNETSVLPFFPSLLFPTFSFVYLPCTSFLPSRFPYLHFTFLIITPSPFLTFLLTKTYKKLKSTLFFFLPFSWVLLPPFQTPCLSFSFSCCPFPLLLPLSFSLISPFSSIAFLSYIIPSPPLPLPFFSPLPHFLRIIGILPS